MLTIAEIITVLFCIVIILIIGLGIYLLGYFHGFYECKLKAVKIIQELEKSR